jgi:thiamine-monophosphate kinase
MLTEFDIIERYFTPRTSHTVLAGGDDAAIIAVGPGMQLAISTDALIAGQHFFEDAEPYGIGYKAMAANLSDMAAMGANPRWATLALSMPKVHERWIEDFARGFLDLASDYGVDLIGGDTTRGPLMMCVQIMGQLPAGKALRRSGAAVGDDIWVSGTVGDAALALAHLRGDFRLHANDLDYAVKRLSQPQPRVLLGQRLIDVASSAIDISDGLAQDVRHIAKQSGMRAVIEWESVPLSSVGVRYREHPLVRQAALAGGDDYELAFTAPPGSRTRVGSVAGELGIALTRVGNMAAGEGIVVRDRNGQPIPLTELGFEHFK